jgi:hypothetical protein
VPGARYRSGPQALADTRRACELSGWKGADALNSLAAAHAENGQYDEAVRWQKKALEDPAFAKQTGEQARRWLRLYEQKKPCREETD